MIAWDFHSLFLYFLIPRSHQLSPGGWKTGNCNQQGDLFQSSMKFMLIGLGGEKKMICAISSWKIYWSHMRKEKEAAATPSMTLLIGTPG